MSGDPRRGRKTGQAVTITKRGKPVAQLVPPVPRQGVYPQDALFGTVKIHGDIVEPVLDVDAWEAGGEERVKALLDTHILIYWLGADERLSVQQKKVLKQASPENPLWVSDITLWEIATLYNLKRLSLPLPLRDWLEAATAPPLIQRVGISPTVAAAVAALPPSFHRDPADRIIIASAQLLVVTADPRRPPHPIRSGSYLVGSCACRGTIPLPPLRRRTAGIVKAGGLLYDPVIL